MSNISKKLAGWEKELGGIINSVIAYAVNGECGGITVEDEKKRLKQFVLDLFLSQNDKIADKLLQALGLTIKDLPAFPPKDIDLFDLILKIGIEKVKREQREEIIGAIRQIVIEDVPHKFQDRLIDIIKNI